MNTGVLNISDGNAIQTERAFVDFFARDSTLATGTQAVTGLGFKPNAVVFFSGSNGANARRSIGAALEGGNDMTHYDDTIIGALSSTLAISYNNGAGQNYQGTVQSYDADGFTISWTKVNAPTGTINTGFIAFK
jgi:hypothetical protein